MHSNLPSEIDLFILANRFFLFIKKNRRVLFILFLLGFFAALLNFLYHPLDVKSYYRKKIIVQTSVQPKLVIVDLINAIQAKNSVLSKRDLAKDLKIDKKFADQLRKISAKLISAQENDETLIEIQLESYSKSYDSLLAGIINYIKSNEYVIENIGFTRKQNLKLVNEIDEIVKNNNYGKFINSDTLKVFNKTINNSVSIVYLLKEKKKIERELYYGTIIEIVNKDYPIIEKNNFLNSIVKILFYGFLCVMIGLLFFGLKKLFHK